MTGAALQYKLGYFEPFALHDRLLKSAHPKGQIPRVKRSWRVHGWKNFFTKLRGLKRVFGLESLFGNSTEN
jgi:hypothetical protein